MNKHHPLHSHLNRKPQKFQEKQFKNKKLNKTQSSEQFNELNLHYSIQDAHMKNKSWNHPNATQNHSKLKSKLNPHSTTYKNTKAKPSYKSTHHSATLKSASANTTQATSTQSHHQSRTFLEFTRYSTKNRIPNTKSMSDTAMNRTTILICAYKPQFTSNNSTPSKAPIYLCLKRQFTAY